MSCLFPKRRFRFHVGVECHLGDFVLEATDSPSICRSRCSRIGIQLCFVSEIRTAELIVSWKRAWHVWLNTKHLKQLHLRGACSQFNDSKYFWVKSRPPHFLHFTTVFAISAGNRLQHLAIPQICFCFSTWHNQKEKKRPNKICQVKLRPRYLQAFPELDEFRSLRYSGLVKTRNFCPSCSIEAPLGMTIIS